MSNQIIPGCCSAGWEHVHCAWVNEFKYLVKHTNKKEIHKKEKKKKKKRAIDRKKKNERSKSYVVPKIYHITVQQEWRNIEKWLRETPRLG